MVSVSVWICRLPKAAPRVSHVLALPYRVIGGCEHIFNEHADRNRTRIRRPLRTMLRPPPLDRSKRA